MPNHKITCKMQLQMTEKMLKLMIQLTKYRGKNPVELRVEFNRGQRRTYLTFIPDLNSVCIS